MSVENKTAELFPSVLRGRAAWFWIMVVPLSLLTVVDALECWWMWGELAGPVGMRWIPDGWTVALRGPFVAVTLATLLQAAVAVACLRRSEPPVWLAVSLGGWCGATFLAFTFVGWDSGPKLDWLKWVQLMGIGPAVFFGLWRLAGWPRRGAVSAKRDFAFSCLTMLAPVVLMFLWLILLTVIRDEDSALSMFIIVSVLVLMMVSLFLGLFRCMMWIRLWLVERLGGSRKKKAVYAALVSLVLPVGGLLLNCGIPFPVDFQNVWAYALAVVNAVFLLVPTTGWRWLDAFMRAGRLVCFPFTCYFFVVFLPFLPLAIPAMLVFGAGVLVLTPMLLFVFHVQALADDRAAARAAGVGPCAVAWRTALCVVALPLAFAARTELDRLALHHALDMVYQPDYGQDARLGVPRAAVRRTLVNAQRFSTGEEYPFLTWWIEWRVFDNLHLRDEKLNTMWRLFVGGEVPAPENGILNLRDRRARARDTLRRTRAQPLSNQARLDDVAATYSVTNGEVETRVTLKISTQLEQQEYRTTVTVPPGVWVHGLRLKIGAEWVDGEIIERKAADWVYRQIARVTRRDPALLRYEDDTHLSLCVFPVDRMQPREVELAFLCPEGYADAVLVGERRVALGDGTVRPLCVWADGVLAKNRLWRAPAGDGGVSGKAADWLVLDCSATNGAWTGAALAEAARGVTGTVRVVWANAETVTETVPADGIARLRPKLAAAGGLNADAALRQVARHCRLTGVTRPRIVFAGCEARRTLETVTTQTWHSVLSEAPGLREVRLTDGTAFPVPGAGEAPGAVSVLSTWSDAWQAVDGRDEVLAFEGAAEAPPVSGGGALDGVVRLPPEAVWLRGAAAWRLQRELDTHPDRGELRRGILRASLGSDVLTAAGSYIVVENEMQRKMLRVKQAETLGGSAALDLVESPAPDGWLLVAALLALVVWRLAPFSPRRHGGHGGTQRKLGVNTEGTFFITGTRGMQGNTQEGGA